MKLKNFLEDDELNRLRDKMRAPLVPYNSGVRIKINDDFLRELWRGKEVSPKDLKSSSGGFTYGGVKVLVYIRKQIYRNNFEYKFHITDCRTLKDAQLGNRYGKYVVSIKTDGMFTIDIESTEIKKEVKAWENARNNIKAKINWQFTTEDARIKLLKLYPTFKE
jgi:hypothetical protein